MNLSPMCTALLLVVLYMLVVALGVVVVVLCRIVRREQRKHELLARWVDSLHDELETIWREDQKGTLQRRDGPHFAREGGGD